MSPATPHEASDQIEQLTQKLVEFYERFSSWELAVVKETGLTLPQMHTLEILGSFGPLRMKELAEKMGVTTGALTVHIDRLERAGLVLRQPNEQDRRSYLIRLSEEGAGHFRDHHALHHQLSTELAGALEPVEVERLIGILEKLNSRF
ncbi:MarR family winged helix-turn-helix transcriptional regulator [Megalodesulfovibrio paquesii]